MKRSALVLLLSFGALALPACGDDTSATGGGGAGTPEGAGGAGAGGASTGGQSATGGAGGEAPLHPAAGEACDALAQDCADPAASKCTLDFDDPLLLPSTCAAALGEAVAGEACHRPDDVPGEDTCAPGFYCSKVNVPASQPDMECHPLCDANEACAEGLCLRLNNNSTSSGLVTFPPETRLVGQCVGTCEDVYDTNTCADGLKCLAGKDIVGELRFSCFLSLDKPAGAACSTNNDCAPTLGCSSGTCRPFCDTTHPCPSGSACSATSFGVCVPPPASWTCDLALFHDGQTCDCACGAADPDCLDPATPMIGCADGEICSVGHCVPPAWTCPGNYYGTADGCDCGCGLLDPDCTDATAASCQFCGNAGSCAPQGTTCPGPIDPTDNSKCQ